MRLARVIGSAALVPLALATAACGGSDKSAAKPSTPSSTAPTAAPATDTAAIRTAADKLNAAMQTWDEQSGLGYGIASASADDLSQSGIAKGARSERDAYFAFDGALRGIDFPASAAAARNAVLTDIGSVIAGLDKVPSATSAKAASDAFFAAHEGFTKRQQDLATLRKSVGLPAAIAAPATKTVYTDTTFTAKPGGWDFFAESTRTVTGGSSYSIKLNGAFSYRSAPTPTPEVTLPTDVSVEATFTTPSVKDSEYGLSCPGTSGNGYEATITPDGSYQLSYAFNSRVEHFLVSAEPGSIKLRPSSNTIRLDCRKIDGGTSITMYLNGSRVDSVGWTQPTAGEGHQPAVVFNLQKPDSVAMSDWKVSSIG